MSPPPVQWPTTPDRAGCDGPMFAGSAAYRGAMPPVRRRIQLSTWAGLCWLELPVTDRDELNLASYPRPWAPNDGVVPKPMGRWL